MARRREADHGRCVALQTESEVPRLETYTTDIRNGSKADPRSLMSVSGGKRTPEAYLRPPRCLSMELIRLRVRLSILSESRLTLS